MLQQAVTKMFAGATKRNREGVALPAAVEDVPDAIAPAGIAEGQGQGAQNDAEDELAENSEGDDSAPDESDSFSHHSRVVERAPNQTPRAVWFKNFPWLSDVATTEDGKYQLGCKICMWAKANNRFLASHRVKDATLASGTFNAAAKKVAGKLSTHESTSLHQHAQRQWNRAETGAAPVSQLISSAALKQSKKNSSALLKVLLCLQFLLGQGLAIRGHIDRDANFWRLLDFAAKDCSALSDWLARTPKRSGGEGPRWLSHGIVEEYVWLLGDGIREELLRRVRSARWYSILCDECTDAAVSQQIAVCLRYCCPETLDVHEVFVALIETRSSKAADLKEHLLRFINSAQLDVRGLRGQGYDGCSTMSGKHSGLSTLTRSIEPRARFVHCVGHRLNLTLQDGIGRIPNRVSRAAFEDVLAVCASFSAFVGDSPKRMASLSGFANADGTTAKRLRPVCPTRWVLRSSALLALIENYENILNWLEAMMNDAENSAEMRGRSSGFLAKFEDFTFFFCLRVLHNFFLEAHPVHKFIQGRAVSISAAQHACLTLKSCWEQQHSVVRAGKQYADIVADAEKLRLEAPHAPRSCRIGRRQRPQAGADAREKSAKHYHMMLYLDLYRCGIEALEQRFENDDFNRIMRLEKLLVCSEPGRWKEEALQTVAEDYEGDLRDPISTYR
ncbi:hypothetical protein FOZ63_029333, partial [Perkinsus olseni]